jgi:predicted PurR-regulated permease PerM
MNTTGKTTLVTIFIALVVVTSLAGTFSMLMQDMKTYQNNNVSVEKLKQFENQGLVDVMSNIREETQISENPTQSDSANNYPKREMGLKRSLGYTYDSIKSLLRTSQEELNVGYPLALLVVTVAFVYIIYKIFT